MYPWNAGEKKQEMAAMVVTSLPFLAFGIFYLCGTKTEPVNRVIKGSGVYLHI